MRKGGEEMRNKNSLIIILAILAAVLVTLYFFVYTPYAGAVAVEKITWCHTEPNGNQQTLELPQQALEQAGHVDANGNPLHAGDHAGTCIEVTPTDELSPTPTVEITLSPTATPSATPTNPPTSGGGDGRSDGLSSCPECTKAPNVDNRSGQPISNQVGWK
jgi:hypothetical protein